MVEITVKYEILSYSENTRIYYRTIKNIVAVIKVEQTVKLVFKPVKKNARNIMQ